MVKLFDQEKIMEIHDYHVAEAARRDGLQEGRAKGHAEGLMEGILTALKSLMKNSGVTIDEAMVMLGVAESDRLQYAEMLKQ